MHRGIVKLNTLPDADGTGTKHDHHWLLAALFLNERGCLVLAVISRVEIRRFRIKFRTAGIHHLVNRRQSGQLCLSSHAANRRVRKAVPLELMVKRIGQRFGRHALFQLRDVRQLIQEPFVDLGQLVNIVNGQSAANPFVYREEALVILRRDFVPQRSIVQLLHGGHRQTILRYFRTAHRFQQGLFKALADRHHLAGSFHLSAQMPLGIHKLIERPFGEFDHHIVQRRFKAGGGFAGHFVANFVQRVAHRDFGGHPRDRITGRFGCQRR